jgi:hypothetical protein
MGMNTLIIKKKNQTGCKEARKTESPQGRWGLGWSLLPGPFGTNGESSAVPGILKMVAVDTPPSIV